MIAYSHDHLHFRSPEPLATARFYIEALGATETGRSEINGGLRIVLGLGDLVIFVEQAPAGAAPSPAAPSLGLEHIGLTVADMDAAAADLKSRGVRFSMEPRQARPGVRIAFIEAPDGVRIELIERSGG
ncbi:lactoylglutathione lyase [Humitalea rosea]|uniref:Lactoylglutathione lyase n=1 Tax=Humitalea rosea TaxID=990373 RepID=A0A2W7IBD3_9PROT|nr:VOC family protein [Humitalea rosea]PZW43679.1 lactoylglutathione lyase [Humitalea rosea]